MPLNGHSVRFADFEVDLKSAELRNHGDRVKLQEQPFQVLVALLERPGEVVTRDDLRHRLWRSDVYVDYERSLNTAVKRLRQALGDEADTPHFIETLPRHGYRFIAEVKPVAEEKAEKPRTRWIALAILSLLMLGMALFAGRELWNSMFPPPIRSIAVLPLQNLTPNPQQEYLADGMTEALISELSRIEPLRVISLTSMMRYRNGTKPLPQIAKELGVDAIVEGSVMRKGDLLRVRTRLVWARKDSTIWSESYDRDVRDVLSVQAEVAHAIANQIQISLSAQEKARVASIRNINPEAQEAYLQGRYFYNRSDFEQSAKAFKRAIARDPQYAPAYAGLAQITALNPPSAENVPKARELVLKALALDESLADAHGSLGTIYFIFDYNWPAAQKELRRALQLDPSSALNHDQYAYFLMATGRVEEALSEARLAQRLDPFSLVVNTNYSRMLYFNRRYDEAIAAFTNTVTLDPRNPPVYFLRAVTFLAMHRYNDAFADLRNMWTITGNKRGLQILDEQKNKGPMETLRAIAGHLEAGIVSGNAQPTTVALMSAYVGDIDKAFQFLELGYEMRIRTMIYLKSDPGFENLRTDPRYKDLLKRMNLPQ